MNRSILIGDLKQAVRQLREALDLKADNDVVKAGCIQYFEFCFELAWKAIKIVSEEHGISDCVSPKNALRTAFRMEWIDDEIVWLDMLMARNKMSHTYSAEQALAIYEKLPVFYENLLKLSIKLAVV